jgi:hypothetical protein
MLRLGGGRRGRAPLTLDVKAEASEGRCGVRHDLVAWQIGTAYKASLSSKKKNSSAVILNL